METLHSLIPSAEELLATPIEDLAPFHADTGKLTNLKAHKPEREALAHLFADAIGAWKNPVSHRGGVLTELREAQDQVMLASHLLRIVDPRQATKP
jgi:hypothetical protein